MTQEDKELLLKDLCARLPYGVIVNTSKGNSPTFSICVGYSFSTCLTELMTDKIEFVKPLLRPMSSMTEDEKEEFQEYIFESNEIGDIIMLGAEDWLNAHHFDYRGLIERGLAIEVTKENNPYK